MTASGRRFIAWGELLWDLFPDGPRLGGAPANAAYHAACLGAEAALVSRVGDDELGARALKDLSARGVDVNAIQIDAAAPTGTVNVEFVDGEPRYAITENVAWDQIEWRSELGPLFATARVICFGTLSQRGPGGFDALQRALSFSDPRALRLCDLNLRQPFVTPNVVHRALSLANVVKLNEAELHVLARLFAQNDVVSWLIERRGVTCVAVTRGARGALLARADQRLEQPAAPLSSTDGDAVGAGDAFSAALGLALAQDLDLVECLARANRYAAHVASQRGAMPAAPAWVKASR